MTVCIPNRRWRNRNTNWKNASSETPVTISGVTSERYIDPAIQGELRFHKAYAASVPITVAIAVAATAINMLFIADSSSSRSASAARYQFNENPCHTVNFDALKLNTARTRPSDRHSPHTDR